MYQEPETATERSSIVTAALILRGALTIEDIERMTGLKRRGAWELMYRISRVQSLVYSDGRWSLVVDAASLPY